MHADGGCLIQQVTIQVHSAVEQDPSVAFSKLNQLLDPVTVQFW